MPTLRIEIENYNNSYHAEVEMPGITAVRSSLNDSTFPGIIAKIEEVYYNKHPEDRLPKAVAAAKLKAQPLSKVEL